MDKALTQFTEHLLAGSNESLAYLESRAIGPDLIVKYRLGVVPEGCSVDWQRYAHHIAIPYLTRTGPVTIRFRRPPGRERGPKYLSLAGDQSRLFNVNVLAMPDGDTLAICEGELDAITVTEYAGIPAVAVPGVSNWQPVFARMVGDYDRILVVGDGDDPGRAFAETLAEDIEGIAVNLPDGEDCNSILTSEGPVALREALGL